MQHPSKVLCNCTTKGCSVCRQHDLEWKLTRLSLDHDLTTWWGTLWTLDQSIEQSCWRISWNILKLSIGQWIQWIQWSLEISFISQPGTVWRTSQGLQGTELLENPRAGQTASFDPPISQSAQPCPEDPGGLFLAAVLCHQIIQLCLGCAPYFQTGIQYE